jgi:REP element-mobilizing transposase RayT
MPVYLLTCHAYRSWTEDHPDGYVQRGQGPKGRDDELARKRASIARYDEVRFEREDQRLLHDVIVAVAEEKRLRLHACVTCPTHVHAVISFKEPVCECGDVEHCLRGCDGKEFAEAVTVRLKRKAGQVLAKRHGTNGKPYFSRGWDVTRVKGRGHFEHLIGTYLPEHQETQAGIFRKYP